MAYVQQTTTVMNVRPPLQPWSTGLCDCFSDFNSCLDVYFCYCCANARQWDAYDGRANSMNMLILFANLCCGTTFCVNCVLRCNINSKYNLDEGSCMACMISWCFPACGMCQQHRELTARGYWPGGVICSDPPANYVAAPAPVNQMGMTGTGFASTNNPGVTNQMNAQANQMNQQFLNQVHGQPGYAAQPQPGYQAQQGVPVQAQPAYQQQGYAQPAAGGGAYGQPAPAYGQQPPPPGYQ